MCGKRLPPKLLALDHGPAEQFAAAQYFWKTTPGIVLLGDASLNIIHVDQPYYGTDMMGVPCHKRLLYIFIEGLCLLVGTLMVDFV